MRHFFTLLLICSAVFINAQSVSSAFITNAEIEWLDKEIGDLKSTYTNLKASMTLNDNTAIAKNKSLVIKSVNRLATNCKITYDKITMANSPETKRRTQALDNPNYYYNKQKANEKLKEIKLTAKSMETLKENYERINSLRDELKTTKYAFHASSNSADANLVFVNDILSLANSTNSILTKSIEQ
ncbi:MAG: hypothetical protein HKO66_10915 [Saprospiraceae bacterium]|nr:hypothetical protein [Bacteroidia bacterium]NNE14337.1 hypothetical protein [Saprospiraceae bacterium]NNL92736.1 hypothetical protein [Saprospiraceae bacterium]